MNMIQPERQPVSPEIETVVQEKSKEQLLQELSKAEQRASEAEDDFNEGEPTLVASDEGKKRLQGLKQKAQELKAALKGFLKKILGENKEAETEQEASKKTEVETEVEILEAEDDVEDEVQAQEAGPEIITDVEDDEEDEKDVIAEKIENKAAELQKLIVKAEEIKEDDLVSAMKTSLQLNGEKISNDDLGYYREELIKAIDEKTKHLKNAAENKNPGDFNSPDSSPVRNTETDPLIGAEQATNNPAELFKKAAIIEVMDNQTEQTLSGEQKQTITNGDVKFAMHKGKLQIFAKAKGADSFSKTATCSLDAIATNRVMDTIREDRSISIALLEDNEHPAVTLEQKNEIQETSDSVHDDVIETASEAEAEEREEDAQREEAVTETVEQITGSKNELPKTAQKQDEEILDDPITAEAKLEEDFKVAIMNQIMNDGTEQKLTASEQDKLYDKRDNIKTALHQGKLQIFEKKTNGKYPKTASYSLTKSATDIVLKTLDGSGVEVQELASDEHPTEIEMKKAA